MASSSITHNFVISNPDSVKRFVEAIDEADRDRTPKQGYRRIGERKTGSNQYESGESTGR